VGGALRRPHDPSLIAFVQSHGMVEVIWADMGLRFPPRVERLPRQARCTLADASRLSIRLADRTPSWCLLHELAHAMSSTHDERSDGHGAKFMRLYTQLPRWCMDPRESTISILQPSKSMVASAGSVVLATTGGASLRPRCIGTKPSLAGV
jgi:hypothetical protein